MAFFSDYKNYVREFRLEEPFDYLIYRPLAYVVVKATLFLPLNPNHFTVLAVICAMLAGYFLVQGTKETMMLGGLFIFLFSVFDCCDGMIARLKKNGSKYGEMIDMTADTFSNIIFFAGVFIGSRKLWPESYMPYLVIAAIVVLSIHVSIYNYYKKQYYFYRDGNPEGKSREVEQYRRDYEEMKKSGKWTFDRFLLSFFLTFAKTQKDTSDIRFDMDRYVDANRSILPLWAVIAGSTHLTVLAVSLMVANINIFLYFTLLLSNLWMVLITIIQSGVNSNLRVS